MPIAVKFVPTKRTVIAVEVEPPKWQRFIEAH